ncbi:response regulator transcription factor [Aquisalimonas lutea]|uniref:response regulator transcription factor n=1 Tax=Aquisalimonas lutea TaxID=1327750 RepID=UPI0025B30CB8|nr:response regulator transcription factor [Aquisalimonas lutea]MDN3518505.1 response regulator transcription factor [Aquisalimonas lutea]
MERMVAMGHDARILVVEDDRTLNAQISDLLQDKGYRTEQSFEGDGALLSAVSGRFDLILLDVLLPGSDGFTVLSKLRKSRRTPVIMLTACGAEEERITGLSNGADDYLAKPFNFTELLLRIEALLRRSMASFQSYSDPPTLAIDGLCLDRRNQSVTYRERPITLTPVQFRLLWTLMQHQHESLSKAYLYQVVLEREFSRYDRSLDMHVSRIRRKLEEAGALPDCLQTVHGKGYCFT